MSDVFPEQKQYQYDNEFGDAPENDTHIPDAVGIYDRPDRAGMSPTMIAIAAVVVLVLLATIIMLLLI